MLLIMSECRVDLALLPLEKYKPIPLGDDWSNGLVARGIDPHTDEPVFIKAKDPAKDPDAIWMIRREANTLASLNHPQIPKLIEADLDGGIPFVVTEFKSAIPDLREEFKYSPDINRAAEVCLSALLPLAYLHSQGFVHRDLKPENLLAHPETGLVSVADFEYAIHDRDEIDEATSWEDGWYSHGTTGYKAPERWDGERGTVATDIYAMGIVLHEFALGWHPFDAESKSEEQRLNESNEINLDDRRYKRTPKFLREVIRIATATDPWDRYGYAEHMTEDLAWYLQQREKRAVARKLKQAVTPQISLSPAVDLGAS